MDSSTTVSSPPYLLSKQINPGDNYPDREGLHSFNSSALAECPRLGNGNSVLKVAV